MPFEQMRAELKRWHNDGHRSVGSRRRTHHLPKDCGLGRLRQELGFTRIAIATNATKLRLHHFTDRILDAGLTRITISMHGHTAELETS